jgi:PIN domain nuclease of toxin-antitoxin system
MRLLLDTHVFLWYITSDPRLPASFLAAIREPRNEVYLSAASVWEAVIKYGLGKLPLPAPAADYLPEQRDAHGIASLPIDEAAMTHLAGLPMLHRDPFDRVLIAQAIQHGLTIATVDPEVVAYPVSEGVWKLRRPAGPQHPVFVNLGKIGSSVPNAEP